MAIVDPRVVKQADILVNHSVKVKKGDRVLIVSDFLARPLSREVYKASLLSGASEIRVNFDVDEQIMSNAYNEFSEIFFKYAKPFQIKAFPKIADMELKNIDCWIRLYARANTRGFSNIDPNKISARAKAVRSLIDRRVLKTRWVISNFPTEAQAQEADMSLSEYEDFVFDSINKVNWKSKFKEQEKLTAILSNTKKVHILGSGTDLILNKAGRSAENAGGECNMPDGEVFTSVVEDSAEGYITYSYPAVYMGKEFHNVRLEFEKGKVVNAIAEKGEKDLNRILDMDGGSRMIGELGIGNNYAIKRFTKDILFDEKIGGSIHIALGKGYEETGSKNESALHWDMIKDLRKGGELWFDDRMVQKDGKWLIKF